LASGSPLELNFGQSTLSRADSCQWVNVWFLPVRSRKSEDGRKKLTEHEVALVTAHRTIVRSNQSPLTFPGGDQYLCPVNLSVTMYFLVFTGS